ncbi:MAG TPA: M28 family peptidase [Candidatus Acidoferrales bacterium]|nr:M28 family peptidase [Candidatus Acidoferrales bacterium]
MDKRISIACRFALCLCLSALACGPDYGSRVASADDLSSARLRGYSPDLSARELGYELAAQSSPNAKTAMADELAIAGRVHRMGQPTDYQTAVYVRNRLARDGFDAKIVTYDSSNVWPVEQHLEITAPVAQEVDMFEPAVAGDPYSTMHAAIGRPYSGFSDDGDAEGPLIYANYGTAADFAELKKLGVDLAGAIFLVKQGHGSAASKGRRVVSYGGKALLLYPEPAYDPYGPPTTGKVYPEGRNRPLGAALRNTMLAEYDGGDPLAIGVPVPGARHLPFSDLRVPPIPVTAITALVAKQLEAELGGPLAPHAWATKVTPNVHVGGVERVHYVLRSRRFIGPIWDVIATLRGAQAPAETVVIGGHRDAWTFGAIDPTSGTVAMLQFADALAKLHSAGWRPFRTIVIGSWDGEELDDIGSVSWVDQNASQLRDSCWAYVNTDEVALGAMFFASATDDLAAVTKDVASVAIAPDGRHVSDFWYAQDKTPQVTPMGTGSDHEGFSYHEGIPSSGITYFGTFGTYHSAYDDPASLRVMDPGMHFADAAARYDTVLMLRLADAPYPEVSMSDLATALEHRLNTFGNAPQDEQRRTAVVQALAPQLAHFVTFAAALDNAADATAAAGNLQALAPMRALALKTRADFYDPGGVPGHPWQGSLLYNSDDTISTLPSLETTLDPKLGEQALNQLVAAFARIPPVLFI